MRSSLAGCCRAFSRKSGVNPEPGGGPTQMRPGRLTGSHRVTTLDRVIYSSVLSLRVCRQTGALPLCIPGRQTRGRKLPPHVSQKAFELTIAGSRGNCHMEGIIRRRPSASISERLLHRLQCGGNACQPGLRAPRRGQLRRPTLDHGAKFEDVSGVLSHQTRLQLQSKTAFTRSRSDESAQPLTSLDTALGLEPGNRFPHHCAADTKALAKLPLGRQLRAGDECVLADPRLDFASNPVTQARRSIKGTSRGSCQLVRHVQMIPKHAEDAIGVSPQDHLP